jgi:hypothetical protein
MSPILPDVSWERMSNAVEKVRERLLRAAKALANAGIPYAVVGGNAVAAWVSRVDEAAVRNTRDVDFLLRRESLDAAKGALGAAGFIHRRVAALGRKGEMDIFVDGPEGKVRDALHIVFSGEKINPDSPEPAGDVDLSEPAGDFQLIALEELVRMKLCAFRDKDRVHLRDLIDVGLVDESWCQRLSPPLRERLDLIFANREG